MSEIKIDTTNVSKAEVEELEKFLEENCWMWSKSPQPKIEKEKEHRYKVHVCRIAYSHLNIEVEAPNQAMAYQRAMNEAGDHSFPTENSSEYTVEGITEIE